MIDVENQVYTKVANALLEYDPTIKTMSRTIYEPSEYPCVCIEQMDTFVMTRTQDSSFTENHDELTYTVNVFSNKANIAKSEAKAIMAVVDGVMGGLNFSRLGCVPVAMDEAQKYRLTARYRAVVGKDETLYRT